MALASCLGSARLDQQDITVLDYIILALGHDLALRPDLGLVAELLECIVVIHNGLDESLLEIAVDDTGRLRRLGTSPDGPLTDFISAGGEEADQIERFAHLNNDLGQCRLCPNPLALLLGLLLASQLRQPVFERDRDGDDRVPLSMLLNPVDNGGEMLIFLPDIVSLG